MVTNLFLISLVYCPVLFAFWPAPAFLRLPQCAARLPLPPGSGTADCRPLEAPAERGAVDPGFAEVVGLVVAGTAAAGVAVDYYFGSAGFVVVVVAFAVVPVVCA